MIKPSLAIIIPAYKSVFFEDTLKSLAEQTDRDFNLYIGDDCSPHNLTDIVDSYRGKLNISYKRFDHNLGRTDLVAHWNRCIDMIKGEDFFIMFSDDDLMETFCISRLKEAIKQSNEDVYHFNLQIIDKNGKNLGNPTDYPTTLSALEFFQQLWSSDLIARMPEFVFRTSTFLKEGGFVNFKDAIRSDNATVINCAYAKGIRTISGPLILWRDSGINISSSVGNHSKEKYETFFTTTVHFFNWMQDFTKKKNTTMPMSVTKQFDYLFSYGHNLRSIIGHKRFKLILKQFNHYPKDVRGLHLWLNLLLLKLKRKFSLLF